MSFLFLFREQAYVPPPVFVYPTPVGGAPVCCERCGFRVRNLSLRKEWTGLRVCGECFDPRPVEMTAPSVWAEGLVRPGTRPEPTPQFIDPLNPVRAEDL